MAAILWFRRDLRVHDHPALHAALEDGEGTVVPVFCLDDRLIGGRHRSGPRCRFMLECLAELDAALRRRGSHLVVLRGPPERELPALARRTGARAIHFTRDVGPFARRRAQRLAAAGTVRLHGHPGLGVVEDPTALLTAAGSPFRVFSPFHRAWLTAPRRSVLPAPTELQPVAGLEPGHLPTPGELGLGDELRSPPTAGETAGRERMEWFLDGVVQGYDRDGDRLSAPGTSRLSAHLHFGCLSARELEERLPEGSGPEAFRRQLAWRDFHHHVLFHHPDNALQELQPRYRGTLRWHRDPQALAAWQRGMTGYPLVDAGMRQLLAEGWMPNRVRMVVGSFLTKDLGIDWREGERWFMRWLVDGDEANNNGNWQWIASVGTDPQPAFRRILNPARQLERFDPDGAYVRRWVPELRAVAPEHLAEPWTMPADVQRRAGCLIGHDYPAPLVDHGRARLEALARYREAARMAG